MGDWCVFRVSGLQFHQVKITSQSQTGRLHSVYPTCHATPVWAFLLLFTPPPCLLGATTVRSMPLLIPISLPLLFWPTRIPLYCPCDVYSKKRYCQSIGQTRNQQSILQGRMDSQSCVRGGFFSILSTCVEERMSTTVNNVTVLRTHRLAQTLHGVHLWVQTVS